MNPQFAIDSLNRDLKGFTYYNVLPADIQAKVKELKEFLNAYKVKEVSAVYTKLEGAILTAEQAKEMVVESSDYTKWKVSENTLSAKDIADMKENLKVDFDNVKRYDINRNGSGTHRVLMTCLPGRVNVMLDNSSVGWYLDGLVKNEKLVKVLSAHLD